MLVIEYSRQHVNNQSFFIIGVCLLNNTMENESTAADKAALFSYYFL